MNPDLINDGTQSTGAFVADTKLARVRTCLAFVRRSLSPENHRGPYRGARTEPACLAALDDNAY